MVSKENFRKNMANVLLKLGITKSKIELFLTGDVPLRAIGICIAITDIIDAELKNIYKRYDGCISTDTFNKIYEFNFCQ